MKRILPLFLFFICVNTQLNAQRKIQDDVADAKSDKPLEMNRMVKLDSSVTTRNTITIKGQVVPYTATAGTLPLWDEDGKAIASVFYTYYVRTDVKDRATRPLVISFNGGPGTPSVWMEI
ncbi:MAG: hypothetical protein ABI172_07370 [Ginsengibacter sp.]